MTHKLHNTHRGYLPKKLPCHQCDAVLDISSFKPLDPIFCPKCKTERVVPAKLGIYEVTGFLGEGAMGRVYLAQDPSLNREVAIKILKEDLSTSPFMWSLLEKEAKIAAGINHPNVIQINTMGKTLGRPYIVMELANYASLDDLMKQGPIKEALAIQIAIDVMRGLEAAYAHELIHGDVKPANILITPKGHAKVADFGLARFLKHGQEVERWGTPYYMAPEKAEQKSEDFRSDLYSLGCTLFHACTGQAPYDAKTGEDVILKAIKTTTPKLHKTQKSFSKELSELIFKMMQKNPDERFWSYKQAIVCFENLQDGCYELGTCKHLKQGKNRVRNPSDKWFTRLLSLVVDDKD